MMGQTELLPMLTTRGAIDAGRRKEPASVGGRGQPSPTVGDRDGKLSGGGGAEDTVCVPTTVRLPGHCSLLILYLGVCR